MKSVQMRIWTLHAVKIRKTTLISCIWVNVNNGKLISLYVKNWYLLHVCCMSFFFLKKHWKTVQPEEFIFCKDSLSNQQFYRKILSSVNIHSLTCNIHSLASVNSLLWLRIKHFSIINKIEINNFTGCS